MPNPMKTLVLIRHAKSSWQDPGLPDHLRPLNKRGKREAPMMGERLARREVEVDRMISSPAVRALATAKAIAQEIGYPCDEIIVDERLYGIDVFGLLEVIQEIDDHLECVMCFGHNPALTELADELSPGSIDNLPTCGVAEFRFETDSWSRISELEPVYVDIDYPKRSG